MRLQNQYADQVKEDDEKQSRKRRCRVVIENELLFKRRDLKTKVYRLEETIKSWKNELIKHGIMEIKDGCMIMKPDAWNSEDYKCNQPVDDPTPNFNKPSKVIVRKGVPTTIFEKDTDENVSQNFIPLIDDTKAEKPK